jgi:hypothetical protein
MPIPSLQDGECFLGQSGIRLQHANRFAMHREALLKVEHWIYLHFVDATVAAQLKPLDAP